MEGFYNFEIIPTREIYYNEDNLYGIYAFETSEKMPHLDECLNFEDNSTKYNGTLVGKMQRLSMTLKYDCEAKLVLNKKYNKWQYEVVKTLPQKPKTQDQQRIFLESVVTSKQAETLLNVYPNIIDMIINDEYIDLSLTKGIKEHTFNIIKQKIVDYYVLSDILIMLSPLGINLNMIKKLSNSEPNPILLKKQLKENPYILTKIHGLGFKKVDKLALQLNPGLKISEQRVKAFVTYYLTEMAESEGHTWVTISTLDQSIKENINDCFSIYQELLQKEVEKERLFHIEGNNIGLFKYYKIEKQISNKLIELNDCKCNFETNSINFNKVFTRFKNSVGYELTDEQKSAVMSLKDNNVVIITGAAGVGKSSVISAILMAFEKQKISMCALSAKAAQRMREITKIEASTIHRLLGFDKDGFAHNKDKPLDSDIIILDEASMVNSSLFLSLIVAIKNGSKVIITFDYAQLPPIGAGNIATDLLESNFVINKFTKIHRQAEQSGIISDANIIRLGKNPIEKFERNLIRGELKDIYYAFRDDKQSIFDMTIKYYQKSLETLTIDDVVIAIPRKKDCVNSAKEFNLKIQELLLGKEKIFMKRGDMIFKKGAKVIQKVNDYLKQVVNGEIGYIVYINTNEKMFKVEYPEKVIEYTFGDLDQIELAYALTVHSLQGSQIHTAIIPLDMSSYMLLSKELIYTAITRASKRCLIIAEPKAFNMGVHKKSNKRNTWLQEIIKLN